MFAKNLFHVDNIITVGFVNGTVAEAADKKQGDDLIYE
jgi:hypothetical protein